MADKQRKLVSSNTINKIVEEYLAEFELLCKTLLREGDSDEELSYRVVAIYGAMSLMIEKFVLFMKDNGYKEHEVKAIRESMFKSFIIKGYNDEEEKDSSAPLDELKN